jgi:hypothetical protein
MNYVQERIDAEGGRGKLTEKSTKGSRSDNIHRSGFEIDENSTGNVFLVSSLSGISKERESFY